MAPLPSSSPGGPSSGPVASSDGAAAAAGALLPLRRKGSTPPPRGASADGVDTARYPSDATPRTRALLPSADLSIVTPAGSGPHGEASSGLYSAESSASGGALLVSSGTRTVTGVLNLAPPGGAPTTRHASPFPSAPSASTAAAVMAGSGPGPDARRKLRLTPDGMAPLPSSSPGGPSSGPVASSGGAAVVAAGAVAALLRRKESPQPLDVASAGSPVASVESVASAT